MIKFLAVFFISMIPILELRFAVPFAVGMDLPYLPALITCVIGNMVPVPFIYLLPVSFCFGVPSRNILEISVHSCWKKVTKPVKASLPKQAGAAPSWR